MMELGEVESELSGELEELILEWNRKLEYGMVVSVNDFLRAVKRVMNEVCMMYEMGNCSSIAVVCNEVADSTEYVDSCSLVIVGNVARIQVDVEYDMMPEGEEFRLVDVIVS